MKERVWNIPSGKTGLPFETFCWNEPKSHVLLIFSYRIFRKIFVNGDYSDFRMSLKNVFGKCSLFALSANGREDQNMDSSFSRQENSSMEKALFDWPIVLQYDVKAKYRLISRKFSGMKFFHPSVRLTNQKPRAFNLYPFDKTIKSLYFRSFVVSVLFARFHFKVIRKLL